MEDQVSLDLDVYKRQTTNIPSYGNGTYKKDTLVKYEFNTTDEHGNKIMTRCQGKKPCRR